MNFQKRIISIITISSLIFLTSSSKILASDPLSTWNNSQPISYPIASHISFIDKNILNIIAGATYSTTSNISQSSINTDGSLSPWTIFGSFPNAIYWHSLARKDNFIYILGGATYPPANSINTVYFGQVNNGSVTSWAQTTNLPQNSSLGNSVVVGNKIYFSGGTPDAASFTTLSAKVYVANINPDGTIGTWSDTTPLPEPLFGHGMIETGSKIVIIGGRSSFLTASDKVYEAIILPDGTLGEWIPRDSLPQPNANFGIAKVGSTVFVVGGINYPGGTPKNLDNVYYAAIENGSIGPWSESQNKLPKSTGAGSLAASDTHLYYTGGYNTNGYTTNVWVAEIQPTTNFPALDVPDIKQYSSPWNTQIYDSANTWSSNPTIERWGCSLTSAAMILQYYNHDIDPGTLNTWLNSHNGYNKIGYINWNAVSRFSLTNTAKIDPNKNAPILEWNTFSPNQSTIINEIENNHPLIAHVPGHFTVIKGRQGSDFLVNDPASRQTLLSQVESLHSGSLDRIDRYLPSNTDLSYIVLYLDPTITIKVFDTNNQEITNSYFVENPLTPDSGDEQSTATPLGVFAYPKPVNGDYRVELTGPSGSYTMDSYLYGKDGNPQIQTLNGLISQGETQIYKITVGQNSKITPTFELIIQQIDNAWNQRKITKLQIYQLIRLETFIAQKLFLKGNTQATKTLLNVLELHLKTFTPTFINSNISKILLNDIETLETNLP